MSKRASPGQSVVSRLAQRNQGGLYRRQMPGGGEVYTGPTATRALRSLGARAFTMDRTIFVAEDFDDSNPEDQALYAHERHHQLNSGGDGAAKSYYDAEELAARAIERMVIHRSTSGEDFGSILRDVESTAMRSQNHSQIQRAASGPKSKGGAAPTPESHGDEEAAAAALLSLTQQGRTLQSIAEELALELLLSMQGQPGDDSSVGFI